MAVTNSKTVVLRGVLVVSGEMTVKARIEFNHGRGQNPAFLSPSRHVLSAPRPGYKPDTRRFPGEDLDQEKPACGAGRSQSLAGVLDCRSLAMPSGQAVLLGWPPAQRVTPRGTLPTSTRGKGSR